MSSRLNLNDDTNDKFEFTIGNLDYDLKYPTLGEIEPIQKLLKQISLVEKDEKLSSKDKETKIDELQEEAQALIYGMILPVGHTTPIKETLGKQPFPVVRAFNKMVNQQFSAE